MKNSRICVERPLPRLYMPYAQEINKQRECQAGKQIAPFNAERQIFELLNAGTAGSPRKKKLLF